MLEMYRQSLEKEGCFKQEYPQILEDVSKVIPGNIPKKMKVLLAATELVVFASHLRKPILWKEDKIPVNLISFLIGGSGEGKGVSIKSVSSVLSKGYKKINEYREIHAKALAIQEAVNDGKQERDWRKYHSKPRNLKAAVSTLPGTMKHLAALEAGNLGAGYMYVDEIGSELVSNADLSENIVALAIGYDSGEIPAKIVKDDANQVDPIENLPYSALMFGSPTNIIEDEKVKRKFKEEFSTKLSRRSFFSFVDEEPELLRFSSIELSLEHDRQEEKNVKAARADYTPWFTALVDSTVPAPLKASKEVKDLFSNYNNYNKWLAQTISQKHPMHKLHRRHLQWKTLKLSGALAILMGDLTIEKHHFIQAIRFSEMYCPDLEAFEIELDKEPYELFIKYMHKHAEGGFHSISLHQLRKLGFITGQGSEKRLTELADLASSADDSTYTVSGKYIHFQEAVEELTYDDELA